MSRDPIWLLWFPDRGVFRPANAREHQKVIDKMAGAERQPGSDGEPYVAVKSALTLGRLRKHHNGLMAYIADVFANWPVSHPFRPDCKDHLRAWLLVEAGHRTVDLMFLRTAGEVDAVKAYNDVERRRARWSFPQFTERCEGGELVGFDVEIFTALSIAWEGMGEDEFRKVSRPIFDMLATIWMPFEKWKKLKGTKK